ncbi:MAG: hypothetical protein JO201_07735 [Verrucomicrobia bacterium]|nr:hypothetical protein [Verrucomicrobiota bacterium]
MAKRRVTKSSLPKKARSVMNKWAALVDERRRESKRLMHYLSRQEGYAREDELLSPLPLPTREKQGRKRPAS